MLLTSPDASAAGDIEALGLNKGDLPSNRHVVWMAFLERFRRANTGYDKKAKRAFLQGEPRNPHRLPEYLGVIETKLR